MLLDIDYNSIQGEVAGAGLYETLPAPPPLNRWVQSFWQLDVPHGQFLYHSVPDNCVDWIINLRNFNDNFLIPPFLSSNLFHLNGPVSFYGIRFRVLGHKGLIHTPLGEWGALDSVLAVDLLPADLVYHVFEPMEKARSFSERCTAITAVLLARIKLADIDPRLARYIRYCCKNLGTNLDLSDRQCAEFGVSSRQLRRLAKEHLGMMPKDFARVCRFQHVLKALYTPQPHNAWLEHYYDQPHFIREFKRLSGLTPSQFVKMSVLYNPKPEG